jgi:hypothetical protein
MKPRNSTNYCLTIDGPIAGPGGTHHTTAARGAALETGHSILLVHALARVLDGGK